MSSIIGAIKNTVSISLFNKGLAGKIFEEVKNTGAKVVMKNNVAECVLISPKEYVKLMDEINEAKLLTIFLLSTMKNHEVYLKNRKYYFYSKDFLNF